MVRFNELRITEDNNKLIIDVSIEDYEYYENMFIDSIVIDNQDTYIINGPSNNPIFTHTVEETLSKIYSIPENNNCNPVLVDEDKTNCYISDYGRTKTLRLILDKDDLKVDVLSHNIFFIYVLVKGIPGAATPCTMDNKTTLGVVFSYPMLYDQSMNFFRELEKDCTMSKGFIDHILKIKGLEMALKTGNYPAAIKLWNKFFRNTKILTSNNCGCYGRT